MKLLLFVILVLAVVMSAPIPSHPDGYLLKPSPQKKVRIDVYEDVLCSDCRNFQGGFKQYFNTKKVNGQAVTDFVEVVVHMFPLPYHHHAFIATQLVPFVFDLHKNNTEVFEYISWMLEHQDDYLEGGLNLTEYQVKDKLCQESSAALKFFTLKQCNDEFKTDAHDWATRVSWKYAAYNSVTGTPSVFLNGVLINTPGSYQMWDMFLTPYLNSTQSEVTQ
eukprot:CAMPEP_0168338350 /NCGR_PEP_ID=MMETSP0213-20121227/12777_1 /TAXON_ID=151035 /ORGANISM="Euplotes harpa, Strain FSP1.4" /LENGTH=219 /DNA_ID=CAMNT_0008344101 /DNA_START=26 /DNA_END=685 /DNA_ORIENTATION=-